MAPMQWRDATVSGTGATGFQVPGSVTARQEPDVRQVFDQVGFVASASQVRQVTEPEVSETSQFAVAGSATALPVGLDLPCTEEPELFFAESPEDVETAKAMCRGCKARLACLTGALERREPWGVWGGELLMRGAIVPRKRPRGRPRKTEVAA
jgi:WhiB family redox-sensing transcriptional regulator